MKILLICAAGMSTSLVEKKLQDEFKRQNMTWEVRAMSSGEAKMAMDKYDVFLLGPQVAYMLDEWKGLVKGKPLSVIPPAIYAMAKAPEIIKLVNTLTGK